MPGAKQGPAKNIPERGLPLEISTHQPHSQGRPFLRGPPPLGGGQPQKKQRLSPKTGGPPAQRGKNPPENRGPALRPRPQPPLARAKAPKGPKGWQGFSPGFFVLQVGAAPGGGNGAAPAVRCEAPGKAPPASAAQNFSQSPRSPNAQKSPKACFCTRQGRAGAGKPPVGLGLRSLPKPQMPSKSKSQPNGPGAFKPGGPAPGPRGPPPWQKGPQPLCLPPSPRCESPRKSVKKGAIPSGGKSIRGRTGGRPPPRTRYSAARVFPPPPPFWERNSPAHQGGPGRGPRRGVGNPARRFRPPQKKGAGGGLLPWGLANTLQDSWEIGPPRAFRPPAGPPPLPG